MSLLMMRSAILAQDGPTETVPPVATGTAWALDTTRTPSGYTLSDSSQTAINTSGGPNYRRWVPSAQALRPSSGRRYWEVACAPGGAAEFDGYLGVVADAQREDYDAGDNPTNRGSIGWRGNGTLWSSSTSIVAQRRADLPLYGAGDIVMFVFDPATASLWIGKNGVWHDDPVNSAPTWSAGDSPAFYPVIQGRNPGDGGTLRSLPAQFSYPVPSGVQPLGFDDPDLRIFAADGFVELGWDPDLSIATFEAWTALGGGPRLTSASAALFVDHGGSRALTAAHVSLYIELDIS